MSETGAPGYTAPTRKPEEQHCPSCGKWMLQSWASGLCECGLTTAEIEGGWKRGMGMQTRCFACGGPRYGAPPVNITVGESRILEIHICGGCSHPPPAEDEVKIYGGARGGGKTAALALGGHLGAAILREAADIENHRNGLRALGVSAEDIEALATEAKAIATVTCESTGRVCKRQVMAIARGVDPGDVDAVVREEIHPRPWAETPPLTPDSFAEMRDSAPRW